MKVTKPKRGRRGTKRLDLTPIRAALADGRRWVAIGVVKKPEGGGEHWEIVGDNADVMVEVELQPTLERVSARLTAGVFLVPEPEDEVVVVLPEGELDFMPCIVALLAHALPSSQPPAPKTYVICPGTGGQVLVHDGAGGAEPLVRRSEFNGHDHELPNLSSGSYTTVPPSGATRTGGATSVTGTTVLKAK